MLVDDFYMNSSKKIFEVLSKQNALLGNLTSLESDARRIIQLYLAIII